MRYLEALEGRLLHAANDPDDTLAEARAFAVTSIPVSAYVDGAIEDPTDADIHAFRPTAGHYYSFDIDTAANGEGGLGSYLRVFNAAGTEVASNNDAAAPGERLGFDAYIGPTLFPDDAVWYVGISNYTNTAYDATIGDGDSSGPDHATGSYRLTITDTTSTTPDGRHRSPPIPPASFVASDGRYDGEVRLSWTSAKRASVYDVYRSPTRSVSKAERIITGTSQTYAIDRSAEPGITYTYWVVARNTGGSSPRSTPEVGSARPPFRLGVTPIDNSLILAGAVAPAEGTAPLATRVAVRNRLELWLSISATASGQASVATATSVTGALARWGLIGPQFDAMFDATFVSSTDAVRVQSSFGPLPAVLNLIQIAFPLAKAPGVKKIGEAFETLAKLPEMVDAYARLMHFSEKPVRHAIGIAKDLYDIFIDPEKGKIAAAALIKIGLSPKDAKVSFVKNAPKVISLVQDLANLAILNTQLATGRPIKVDFLAGPSKSTADV